MQVSIRGRHVEMRVGMAGGDAWEKGTGQTGHIYQGWGGAAGHDCAKLGQRGTREAKVSSAGRGGRLYAWRAGGGEGRGAAQGEARPTLRALCGAVPVVLIHVNAS